MNTRTCVAVVFFYKSGMKMVNYRMKSMCDHFIFALDFLQKKGTYRLLYKCHLVKSPGDGFEPSTNRLTVYCSTAELTRNVESVILHESRINLQNFFVFVPIFFISVQKRGFRIECKVLIYRVIRITCTKERRA